jgi:hypothetical protein
MKTFLGLIPNEVNPQERQKTTDRYGLFLEPRNTRNDAGGNSLVIHRFVNFIFWVATLLRQMLRG